jgi:hypothetical protein
MKLRILYLIVVLLLTLFVVACQPLPSMIDDNSCSAPCWTGIIPGETNREEALEILKSSSLIKQDTITSANSQDNPYHDQISWDSIYDTTGFIFLENNTVEVIIFLDENVPLQELIQKYGDPDQVIIAPFQGSSFTIYTLYLEKGIFLSGQKREIDHSKIKIQTNDKINYIAYLSLSTYQKFLEFTTTPLWFELPSDTVINIESLYQPWKENAEYMFITPVP